MQGDQCKYDHGTDAVVIEDSTVPAYNPSDPSIGGSKPDLSVPPPGYSEPYVPGTFETGLKPFFGYSIFKEQTQDPG